MKWYTNQIIVRKSIMESAMELFEVDINDCDLQGLCMW